MRYNDFQGCGTCYLAFVWDIARGLLGITQAAQCLARQRSSKSRPESSRLLHGCAAKASGAYMASAGLFLGSQPQPSPPHRRHASSACAHSTTLGTDAHPTCSTHSHLICWAVQGIRRDKKRSLDIFAVPSTCVTKLARSRLGRSDNRLAYKNVAKTEPSVLVEEDMQNV
jgi:hypothetical protein